MQKQDQNAFRIDMFLLGFGVHWYKIGLVLPYQVQ